MGTATTPAWAKLCDQWPGDQKRKRLFSTTASDVEGCQDQCDKISDCRMILFVQRNGKCKVFEGVDSPDPIKCDVADRRRKSVAVTHFKCEYGRGADGHCLSAFLRPCSTTTTETMVESFEGWVANQQVSLQPFELGVPLRAMSQQAISTPGVSFNNVAVEKGATYEYSVEDIATAECTYVCVFRSRDFAHSGFCRTSLTPFLLSCYAWESFAAVSIVEADWPNRNCLALCVIVKVKPVDCRKKKHVS